MRTLALLLSTIFVSCSGSDVPKDVMPPEKMQAVLYDVILADELADFSSIQDSTYRELEKRTVLYDSIFQIHNITKQAFHKSFKFYQQRPDLLRTILDSLQAKPDTIPREKLLK
jgi:hypothetical protein